MPDILPVPFITRQPQPANVVLAGPVSGSDATPSFRALQTIDVGLDNVDNTSDVAKPVSTAQQAAIDAAIAVLTNLAPGILDTFKEVADQLAIDESGVAALVSAFNALGDASTHPASDFATAAQGTKADAAEPSLGNPFGEEYVLLSSASGTRAWGIPYEPRLGNPSTNGDVLSSTTAGVRSWVTPGAGGDMLAANNLSDLASAATSRTNLGLGSLATQSGTFSGTSSGTNTGDQTSVSGNAGTVTNGVYTTDTGTVTNAMLAGSIANNKLANGAVANLSGTNTGDQNLSAYALLASPTFTGVPASPTAALGTNSTQLASTAFVKAAIDALIAGAPGALDTLKEISDQLATDESAVSALTTTVASKVPSTRTVNGHALSADVIVTASDVSLGSVENAAASGLYVPLTRTVNGQALSGNITITSVSGNAGTVTNGVYTTDKDATGGVAGLTLFKINFKNAANTFTNFFTNATTAARTYTFPDATGTVALTSDITGTNSGTNTGDQTISDATISTTDITTNNVSTSKHGFAPKAPNDVTKFLDGTGAYSVPSGGAAVANVTGPIGLAAVNGSASTASRSDSSPALSQSIAPTWTGAHTFSVAGATSAPAIVISGTPFSGTTATAFPLLYFNETGATAATFNTATGNFLGVNANGGTKDFFWFGLSGTQKARMSNAGNLTLAGTLTTISIVCLGLLNLGDQNLYTGTTTGTKIGTATNQKVGFWNATPIVQVTTGVAAATFVTNTSGTLNDTATWDGYTLGQVVKALRNMGLLA